MKKCVFIAIALCVVAAMAVPAMALEAKFSGDWRIRGFYLNHMNLREDVSADASKGIAPVPSPNVDWYDMRMRLRTILKINDWLQIDSRIRALDNHVLGTSPTAGTNYYDTATSDLDNVYIERLWLDINTEYGKLQFGRTPSGWGTEFKRNAGESDRAIIYSTPMLWKYNIFCFQYLIASEGEKAQQFMPYPAPTRADNDGEYPLIYWLFIHPRVFGGILATWYHNAADSYDLNQHLISPFATGKTGPWNYTAELDYTFGSFDWDSPSAVDQDYDALAWWVEGGYTFGPFNLTAGYLYNEGDNNAADDTINNTGGIGEDWNKLLILNGDDMELQNGQWNLGGYGALGDTSGTAGVAARSGAKIFYATLRYSPLEVVSLSLTWGTADADSAPTGFSQEYGSEYDFNLNWKIMPNLDYHFAAAYLDAGDFWRGPTNAKLENMTGVFHELTVNF